MGKPNFVGFDNYAQLLKDPMVWSPEPPRGSLWITITFGLIALPVGDAIVKVGKGVEGADCIQIVRNSSGKECGKIIYESKRTKGWSSNWIDKLKTDMRSRGADVAILVTQTFPKDMERLGEKDGVWVCSFAEAASVAAIIRNSVLKVYEVQRSEENKGDKMQMLYDYLTGVDSKDR